MENDLYNIWIKLKKGEEINYPEFEYKDDEVRKIPENIDTPYQFFKLFFDDDIMNFIIIKSNMYANYYKFKNIKPNKENNNKKKTALKFTPTTLERLERFIAAKILMGIYKLTSKNDYFSNNPLLDSPVKNYF